MKDLIFYFSFTNENSEEENYYSFIVKQFGSTNINMLSEAILDEDWYDDALSTLEEKYGIHDWSSSPDARVDAVGYCSYEVNPDKYFELMNEWRDAFAAAYPSLEVTNVVNLPNGELMSSYGDYEIYIATLDQLAKQ